MGVTHVVASDSHWQIAHPLKTVVLQGDSNTHYAAVVAQTMPSLKCLTTAVRRTHIHADKNTLLLLGQKHSADQSGLNQSGLNQKTYCIH